MVVIRVFTVEMKAPTRTAATPMNGRSQRGAAAGAAWIGAAAGIGVAATAAGDALAIDQVSARGGVTVPSARRR